MKNPNTLPILPSPQSKSLSHQETPKTPRGLPPGGVIGAEVDQSKTIVLCENCDKPLWEVYPVIVLGPFSSYQQPSKPIGHDKKIPDRVGCPSKMYECPFCHLPWPKYSENNESFRYKTSKGYC